MVPGPNQTNVPSVTVQETVPAPEPEPPVPETTQPSTDPSNDQDHNLTPPQSPPQQRKIQPRIGSRDLNMLIEFSDTAIKFQTQLEVFSDFVERKVDPVSPVN